MILIQNYKDMSVKAPAQTAFALPVKYNGVISSGPDYFGVAAPDNTVQAENADLGEYYPIGSTMKVLLRSEIQGKILNMLAGGSFLAGDYLKFTTGGKLIEDIGGVKATATVGTVVFTAISTGTVENSITVQTTIGVAAGSEVVTTTGTYPNLAIVVQGNAASSIGQVQTAIAANTTAAAAITADSLTTFAAGAEANLAGGTDVVTVNRIAIAKEAGSLDAYSEVLIL